MWGECREERTGGVVSGQSFHMAEGVDSLLSTFVGWIRLQFEARLTQKGLPAEVDSVPRRMCRLNVFTIRYFA